MIVKGMSVNQVKPIHSVQVKCAAQIDSPGVIKDYLRLTAPYKSVESIEKTVQELIEIGVEKRLAMMLVSYTYPRNLKVEDIALLSNSLGIKMNVSKTEKIVGLLMGNVA